MQTSWLGPIWKPNILFLWRFPCYEIKPGFIPINDLMKLHVGVVTFSTPLIGDSNVLPTFPQVQIAQGNPTARGFEPQDIDCNVRMYLHKAASLCLNRRTHMYSCRSALCSSGGARDQVAALELSCVRARLWGLSPNMLSPTSREVFLLAYQCYGLLRTCFRRSFTFRQMWRVLCLKTRANSYWHQKR